METHTPQPGKPAVYAHAGKHTGTPPAPLPDHNHMGVGTDAGADLGASARTSAALASLLKAQEEAVPLAGGAGDGRMPARRISMDRQDLFGGR